MGNFKYSWRRCVFIVIILIVLLRCRSTSDFEFFSKTFYDDNRIAEFSVKDKIDLQKHHTGTSNFTCFSASLNSLSIPAWELVIARNLLKLFVIGFYSVVLAAVGLVIIFSKAENPPRKLQLKVNLDDYIFCNSPVLKCRKSLKELLPKSKFSHSQWQLEILLKGNEWLFDIHSCFGEFSKYWIYPAFLQLASYSPLSYRGLYQNSYSFIELAEAGFEYCEDQELIKCTGCGKKNEIFSVTTNPGKSIYHNAGCKYIKVNGYLENTSPADTLKDSAVDSCSSNTGVQDKGGNEINEASLAVKEINRSDCTTILKEASHSTTGIENVANGVDFQDNFPKESEFPSSDIQQTATKQDVATLSKTPQSLSSCSSTGATASSPATSLDILRPTGHPDSGFYDSTTFIDESFNLRKKQAVFSLHPRDCEKNRGHFGYYPTLSVSLGKLPTVVRCEELVNLIKLSALLTVRIVVKRKNATEKYLFGTGSCFTYPCTINMEEEHSKKWSTVKKHLPFTKGKYGEIYIETNRHIINNDLDAKNATAEFFDVLNKITIVVNGVTVKHSTIPGDNKSILICRTANLAFVDKLNACRTDFEKQVRNLPQNVHNALLRKVFIISHPHGQEQVLSYGDCMVIKYKLTSGTPHGMEKLGNNQQLPQDQLQMVRKVLLYTANTCPGSSGSPIIRFKRVTGSDGMETGSSRIELDLWMHNGVDVNHDLSASVAKELTTEDIADHGNPSTLYKREVSQIAGDGVNSFTEVVVGPVYTVIGQPAYPAYILNEKRLESLKKWAYEHIHSRLTIAATGFFYAGYADCVRCFHCGLGLKTWKVGDNLLTEHYKHKPKCSFLQALLKTAGIQDPDRQLLHGNVDNQMRNADNETSNTASSLDSRGKSCLEELKTVIGPGQLMPSPAHQHTAIVGFASVPTTGPTQSGTIKVCDLVKRENQLLQKQMTCKVCSKRPLKVLFLPCGELYACSECSQLLVNCPSCKKKIDATVTVYFS